MPPVDELEPVVRIEVHFHAVYTPSIVICRTCGKWECIYRSDIIFNLRNQVVFAGSAAILVKSYAPL